MWIVGLLLLLVGGLVGAVATVFIAGLFIPRTHVASTEMTLKHSPDEVWAVISDFEHAPEWRTGVEKIERLEDRNGKPMWREHNKFQPMTMEVTESDAPKRLVTTIADDDLPFGGKWIYELSPAAEGCTLTITEDGFINPAPYRFISYFFAGYHGTQLGYHRALAKRLGESAEPAIKD